MIENPRLTAIVMAAIIIFLLLACAFVYMTTPNKFRFFDLPVAYCHRGIHDEKVPENSIPAFKRCAEKEMGVELDVQPTKDGKIVVFHRRKLYMVTNQDHFPRLHQGYQQIVHSDLTGFVHNDHIVGHFVELSFGAGADAGTAYDAHAFEHCFANGFVVAGQYLLPACQSFL